MTSQFEQLFASTVLDVVVPNTSLEFPPSELSRDEWLETLRSGTSHDRKEAFFDEHIQAVLTARIPHPEEAEKRSHDPPPVLLSFLSHLQISLEASYISPTPDIPEHTTATPRSDAPPRSASLRGKRPMALNLSPNPQAKAPPQTHHPSILPPATPIPMPASGENDRRYAQSEGIMLCTRIWGGEGPITLGDDDDDGEEEAERDGVERKKRSEAKPKEAFHLVWSENEEVWVAAYKVVFTVAFLRLPFRLPAGASPLLCITLSTTLREHPVAVNGPKNPLSRYISNLEGNRLGIPALSPTSPNSPSSPSRQDASALKGGLAEVNLLGGLFPTTSDPQSPTSPNPPSMTENPAEGELVLPSTRLGPSMRSSLFHLGGSPDGPPLSPQPSPMQTPGGALKPASHPTLRKSFRKTLFATSGFRVRMRTVFVPSLLLEEDDDEDDGDDPLTSGPEEGTVVLCVEVENEQDPFAHSSDCGGRNAGGILVERVEVSIGGGENEGASAQLIGWGADALLAMRKKKRETLDSKFPLLLTPREQFNLLYAVTFLRNPEEVDVMSTVSLDGRSAGSRVGGPITQPGPGKDMIQRSVTLKIFGRPSYVYQAEAETSFYPTATFCTRWNCVLDLSTTSLMDRRVDDEIGPTPIANPNQPFITHAPSALPEPASPFPASIASPRFPPPNPGSLLAGDIKRASLATYSRSGPSSRSSTPANGNPNPDRRHTIAAGAASGSTNFNLIKAATAGARNSMAPGAMSPPLPAPERRDTYGFPPPRERRDSGRGSPLSYTPPSSVLQSQMPRSPTTYEAPPPPPFKDRNGALAVAIPGGPTSPGPSLDQVMGQMPPMTPAYPAYPTIGSPSHSPLPPTPPSQGPFIPQGGSNVPPGQGSYSGPSVDVRREKGMMMMGGPQGGSGHSPQTPAPHVGFGMGGAAPGMFEGAVGGVGINMNGLGGAVTDPIVVSIGLKHKSGETDTGKIHPSDTFTLDIFVFNKSSWTRRFDISCPDPRMLRKRNQEKNFGKALDTKGRAKALPGVVPLENRVRIGPLLPSACQSVAMDFIALAPGVHSIDSLTLTDTESGYAMNLRSVMDVVVHENSGIS
ncbi:hypothetical protein V5O48_010300 [Marasmius crinis-equi]|uniref:Trafficking protein particle complex II-specific subunit 65 IgD3 domain-containing protein n=1 Tax=Marasmius crinis-equi TaxID=585013 RepID=A0ABR3F8T8_9AGAR